MKRLALLLPLLALAPLVAVRAADAPSSNACDRLCLELLADAAAARRNVVFSPFSLSGALGMAALGAKGETLAQIDRIAGTGLDPGALAEREAGVRDAILDAAREGDVELLLADSLWKRKGDAPLPDFAERLRSGFGAEILDFGFAPASAVNRWVSKKTKGLLPSVFDDIPSGTRLALVDAVYFKARWAVPFERERTSKRTFHPEEGEPLFLMRFTHCAVVEVDERGTTAAAASGMSFGCSAPVHPDFFVVDRPFVFFIREPEGRLLFAGAVFDP